MGNIALQIERTASGIINAGENVVFEATAYSDGNISYNNTTGVITFNEQGRYIINWWVSTQSSSSTDGVVFALSSSQGDFIVGNSPTKTGEIIGVGIVNVSTAPVTLSLVNGSIGNHFYAAQIPLKAALVVTKDDVVETVNGRCLAVAQLVNIISQMINTYSTTTWSVFSHSLASYSGVPLDLYTSPNALGPGLLRLIDLNDDYEALPIINITALYPGDGTVYDSSFTYFPPPDPLPQDCDADMLAAIQSYLPIGTPVDIRFGPQFSASRSVYRNEYGVLVLSDDDGNNPVFLAAHHILRIFTTTDPNTLLDLKNGSGKSPIIILK